MENNQRSSIDVLHAEGHSNGDGTGSGFGNGNGNTHHTHDSTINEEKIATPESTPPVLPKHETPIGDTVTSPTIPNPSTVGVTGDNLKTTTAGESAPTNGTEHVLYSDIGVHTLLNRLKQSLASARELAAFFKGLSKTEDQKAASLRNVVKSTHRERHESRSGSYAHYFEQVTILQDRIANNGVQLSLNLSQMHDDLLNMAADKDRERKHWKSTGLAAEERTLDMERALERAKSKYVSLAEDYDAARTGDKTSRPFGGLRSIGKTGPQQEEDLHRRAKLAEEEYQAKVQSAQSSRHELLSSGRPQTIRALQQLADEVDNAVVMQLQKFAAYSEQTLLRDGLLLAPGNDGAPGQLGLRDLIAKIDNEQDFRDHINSFSNQVPPKKPEIKYEQHPAMIPRAPPAVIIPPQQPASLAQRTQTPTMSQPQMTGTSSFAAPQMHPSQGPPQQNLASGVTPQNQMSPDLQQSQQGFKHGRAPSLPAQDFGRFDSGLNNGGPTTHAGSNAGLSTGTSQFQQPGGYSGANQGAMYTTGNQGPATYHDGRGSAPYGDGRNTASPYNSQNVGNQNVISPQHRQQQEPYMQSANNRQVQPTMYNYGPESGRSPTGVGGAANQYQNNNIHDIRNSPGTHPSSFNNLGQHHGAGLVGAGGAGAGVVRPTTQNGPTPALNNRQVSPPGNRRMFGVSLDELFTRDKTPVPLVVIQCIQAVDQFGLTSEGIYRVSGNQSQLHALKNAFDTDASRVDFRNPEAFYHDAHVPATLLKLFFRELPDSLFTRARYDDFIRAAQIEDEVGRRDNLHAIINDLPDPNYATLRALILHLHRVTAYADSNRMSPANLAMIFGPTLMGPHTGLDMALGALQPKVINTILQHALQIFDED